MASIQRRTSKAGVDTWRVGFRRDGKLCWSPTLTTGDGAVELKELIERLGPDAALAALNQRSGRSIEGPPLMRDWFPRHLELLGADCTPGTIADYRGMAERTWLPRFGPLPIDTITREQVQQWVAWQRRQPTRRPGRMYSPKSIANAHGLLSSVLASAVEHELIVRNVARGVGLPDDDVEHEMEIFTADEWTRFYEAMDPHYRPLILFLLATGMRIGEATAVQVRDLDLDATMPTIRVRRAWKKAEHGVYLGSTKTRRGVRTIVLPPDVVTSLRPRAALAADTLVFTGRRGGRIPAGRFRERQWEAALVRAGITKHLTPHSLRHTSASWLLTAGIAPQVVQHRLGHESLSTTSRVYAHLMTDAQVGAAAFMAGATSRPRQIEG